MHVIDLVDLVGPIDLVDLIFLIDLANLMDSIDLGDLVGLIDSKRPLKWPIWGDVDLSTSLGLFDRNAL